MVLILYFVRTDRIIGLEILSGKELLGLASQISYRITEFIEYLRRP